VNLKLIDMPLSWIYGSIVAVRRALWRCHLPRRLPVPVISVGNISVGGTGKTEMVIMICEHLRIMGWKPGILSRGYRRKSRLPALIVSAGKNGPDVSVEAAGDEPYLMATRLPDVPVVVGKDRIATGNIAVHQLGCNILVLDDGFQRRDQVARDLDIVLIDAADPFGGSGLLPAGRLREPLSSLKEADIIVVTRADQYTFPSLFAQLAKLAPEKPLLTAKHAPQALLSLHAGIRQPLEYLANRRVLAVSGIARPESFKRTLEKLKAEVTGHFSFPDHHWFSDTDLKRIQAHVTALQSEIITTAKDAVRFSTLIERIKVPVWILEIRMIILSRQEGIRPYLEKVLDSWKKKGPIPNYSDSGVDKKSLNIE